MKTDQPESAPLAGAPVDETRRRIAKGGVAAPVVLASLASQKVLGAPLYKCTISGQMSGNTSSHSDEGACNEQGRSPGYWKTHTNWPSPMKYATLNTGRCAGTSIDPNKLFKTFFDDAFHCKNGVCIDYTHADFATSTTSATLVQVLKTGGGLNDNANYALGRAAVASLLNAYAFAPDYPLTAQKVKDMFNAVYKGGSYPVNASVSWNRDHVKTYFESLYGGL